MKSDRDLGSRGARLPAQQCELPAHSSSPTWPFRPALQGRAMLLDVMNLASGIEAQNITNLEGTETCFSGNGLGFIDETGKNKQTNKTHWNLLSALVLSRTSSFAHRECLHVERPGLAYLRDALPHSVGPLLINVTISRASPYPSEMQICAPPPPPEDGT